MRPIDEIVMHCSATPEGRAHDVADIDRWHRARGWSGIGYHYLVHLDGTVEAGRPVERQGAHVRGRNRRTIGVCYVGGVARDGRTPKDTRTPAQRRAIDRLLRDLLARFPAIHNISGHNHYAARACPSYDASEHAHLTGRTPPPPRLGASGAQVSRLQRLLVGAGYEIAVDGDFGPATREAVQHFQTHLGVRADGVPGEFTLRRLREAAEAAKARGAGEPFAPKPRRPAVPRQPAAPFATHSKLVGAVLGGVIGAAAAFGLPVAWTTPELQVAATVLGAAVFTWMSPANAS